jgi:hypothetical protein
MVFYNEQAAWSGKSTTTDYFTKEDKTTELAKVKESASHEGGPSKDTVLLIFAAQ